MKEAIGLIETMGIIAAIEASDVMLKTSNVTLLNKEIVKGGLVTVVITGDVSAVKTAVDAAVVAVNRLGVGLLMSSHVMARPDRSIESLLPKTKEKSESNFSDVEESIEEMPVVSDLNTEIEEIVIEETVIELQDDLSEIQMKELLDNHQKETVRSYLLDKTVAQLREMAKQHNDFVIERKELYRTNKSDLVEGIINYLSNQS
ncbi:BMC domain-containing protein [Vagococcus fluvialis]|uniref:BMC domain-containing protein n=1 Tax=Vagococcus fluvialis TaxID=2738 RepID=UPI001432ECA3|nr:BMC domain-containing protein [Vagococcus fluvialis]MBO0480006.1 BMC domain-containing protein [Vagococcus fluvialis]MBO0484284.1 BMC domain-containing protein [Vagococcus fluvialis]MBO0486978.1 BMC domain-containing protein [Vagococcus fluvialis]NKC58863.1 BMC domain-containing protein [Vagococcus fluvialis]NKD49617.1 BMC domain-containing protein [Vagococcus fluvialis]